MPEILTTNDGSLTLVHPEHGETYHSHLGAITEAEQLYCHISGFSQHINNHQSTSVLDVGLGLGYNSLTAIETFSLLGRENATLHVYSLEIDRVPFLQFASGTGAWQKTWSPEWLEALGHIRMSSNDTAIATFQIKGKTVIWQIQLGDARETILSLQPTIPFHFVWQDAFSPKNNPELWTKDWFLSVASKMQPGGKLATYSVARSVKDALTDAGWQYKKVPSFGKAKKHWLIAHPLSNWQANVEG